MRIGSGNKYPGIGFTDEQIQAWVDDLFRKHSIPFSCIDGIHECAGFREVKGVGGITCRTTSGGRGRRHFRTLEQYCDEYN